MTRVLFLTESFHPVLGGGETHIRGLAGRLSATGFVSSVVTRRGDAAWPSREMIDGIEVERVGPSGPARGGKYGMVPAALAALFRRRRNYDVLVVRGTRVLGLPGLVAARALDKPVVLQAEVNGEMTGEVYTWGTRFAEGAAASLVHSGVKLRNLWMRDADAFVAMSSRIRDEFLASGVEPQRVHWIPHGIDLARFRPSGAVEAAALRERLALPAQACILTYTGRLLRGKGLEGLIDAFIRVVAEHGDAVHLVLVGSGHGQMLSVEEDLRRLVAAKRLAHQVRFTGRVDDVEDWLRASDVFVFPSTFEALGLSLVEAAAAGLACVGARTGGIVDVISNDATGLLVEPGDTAALAGAITALVRDPGLRRRLGAAARAHAEQRFDAADAASKYRSLFGELAARRRCFA